MPEDNSVSVFISSVCHYLGLPDVKLIGIPFVALLLHPISPFLRLTLSVCCRRLICIPLCALNDSPPLCMHLIIPRSVYLVCVCLCTRVWAKSVDTLITSSLSSETAAGATVVMSPFDCCCSSDPEIVIIYVLTVDTHLCVLFILLSLPSRPGGLMWQIKVPKRSLFFLS